MSVHLEHGKTKWYYLQGLLGLNLDIKCDHRNLFCFKIPIEIGQWEGEHSKGKEVC